MKEGKGEFFLEDGTIISGMFGANSLQGDAVIRYNNGDIYTGEIDRNMKNGKGEFCHCQNGNQYYIGQYADDMRHGEGILRFLDGGELEGKWSQGKLVCLLLNFRMELLATEIQKEIFMNSYSIKETLRLVTSITFQICSNGGSINFLFDFFKIKKLIKFS